MSKPLSHLSWKKKVKKSLIHSKYKYSHISVQILKADTKSLIFAFCHLRSFLYCSLTEVFGGKLSLEMNIFNSTYRGEWFEPRTSLVWEATWPTGLGRWIWNLEVPGSNPPPYHYLDLFSVVPSSTPGPRCVNSQLVSLPPVGFLNSFFFAIFSYLFTCLLILHRPFA